jgi:hypothetical protein
MRRKKDHTAASLPINKDSARRPSTERQRPED